MTGLRAGELLGRRYRLIDQIGVGGMSVIWRARDEVLDRLVAVKVLAAALAADAKFRDMVREEARAAAQLVHPHVTAVHDYGESIAPDGTITSFVVMELLSGEELEARLRGGPLPWSDATEICAQVAEALAAAHRLGIVHRDVTPANIMLTTVGAKVLDFGIATHVGAPDEDEEGDTFGTPAYVAPERLDGRPAQPTTDTYSLGVLLFETLTGSVPYPADTWDDLTEALQQDVPPLTDVPGLPPAVADICQRCLAHDPQLRPTARHVGEVLRAQLPLDPQVATMLAPTVVLPITIVRPVSAQIPTPTDPTGTDAARTDRARTDATGTTQAGAGNHAARTGATGTAQAGATGTTQAGAGNHAVHTGPTGTAQAGATGTTQAGTTPAGNHAVHTGPTGTGQRTRPAGRRSPFQLLAATMASVVALAAAVLLGLSLRTEPYRDDARAPGTAAPGLTPGPPTDPSVDLRALPAADPTARPVDPTQKPTAPTAGTPTPATGASTPPVGPPARIGAPAPTTARRAPGGVPAPTGGAPAPTGEPPAPTGGAPAPTGEAQPTPGSTPAASTAPPTTTAPAPTVGQAAADFRVRLEDGLASGDIRADVGQDLRSLSGGLRDAEPDVAPLAKELRRKVNVRAREGAITDQYAGILEDAIDRILALT